MVWYGSENDWKIDHRSQIRRANARIVKRSKHRKQRELDKKIISGDESALSEVNRKEYEPVIYYQGRYYD
jgi:hypothetical protein